MFGAYWPVVPEPPKGPNTFRILKYADKEWVARHQALPVHFRDIHFDPRILASFKKAFGCEFGLAVTGDAYTLKNFIMQPVLVTKDGQLRHGYQFGGPIGVGINSDLVSAHNEGLHKWASGLGATNELCVLNPFLWSEQLKCMHRPTTINLEDQEVVDLKFLGDYASTGEIVVKTHHIYTNLRHFLDLYGQGNALWFEYYAKFLYPYLLLAHYEGKVVGAALVVHKGIYGIAYYHFEALAKDCPPETQSLLVQEAAHIVKAKGAKFLCIGGAKSNIPSTKLPTYIVQKNYV